MKYFIVFFFLIFGVKVVAQERLARLHVSITCHAQTFHNPSIRGIDENLLKWPQNGKLYSVALSDGYFHRTYVVDKNGETISSGFMPSMYFRANSNPIVFAGQKYMKRDSFNPYGAGDLAEMLFFGTVNNFITKLRFKKR